MEIILDMVLYMYVFVDDYQKDYCSETDKKVIKS